MAKDSRDLICFTVVSLCLLSGLSTRLSQQAQEIQDRERLAQEAQDRERLELEKRFERVKKLRAMLGSPMLGYNICEPAQWQQELLALIVAETKICEAFRKGLQQSGSPVNKLNDDVVGVVAEFIMP
ncbi:MAG: hypothetical protein K0S29_535 [Gammaproteobacteria bacterium]|jgi:hypothetical protein|nr:hypothetical protein [Gammaproteobacteria bacterium]